MTDDHVLKLWLDEICEGERDGTCGHILRFAALIREECERTDRDVCERIMSEQCPSDEKHCMCVPVLRKGIEALRNRAEDADAYIHSLLLTLVAAKAQIARLEADLLESKNAIASLEGDVDEAEQTVADLRTIEAVLRGKVANLEK